MLSLSLWYTVGILSTSLVIWIAVIKYRRNRVFLPQAYARYGRRCDATDMGKPKIFLNTEINNDDVENVVLVGGECFLGRSIVEILLASKGERVHIHIFDTIVPPPERRNDAITYISGDVRVPGHLERAFNSVNGHISVVYHLASLIPGQRNTESSQYDVTVEGTSNVVHILTSLGKATKKAPLLIYTSTAMVALGMHTKKVVTANEKMPIPKEMLSAWVACKAKAESIIHAADGPTLSTCILRPTVMFGQGDKVLADLLLNGKFKFYVGPGDNLVNFVHVQDVAMGHVLAADAICSGRASSGSIYNLGGETPVTTDCFFGKTETYTPGKNTHWGHPLPYHLNSQVSTIAAFLSEVVSDLFALPMYSQLTEDNVAVMTRSVNFDSSKAKREIGYEPTKDILQTIRSLVRAHKREQDQHMRGQKILQKNSSKRLSIKRTAKSKNGDRGD